MPAGHHLRRLHDRDILTAMVATVLSMRTRLIAIALMMAIVAVCAGALVQPAMAFAMGHDCAGCEDQIACGPPTQPQVTPSPSTSLMPLAVPASRETASIVADDQPSNPPPIVTHRSAPAFAPSAPRSPPSA